MEVCGAPETMAAQVYWGRDINTTRIYLRLSDEDLRREVSKLQF